MTDKCILSVVNIFILYKDNEYDEKELDLDMAALCGGDGRL